MLLPRGHIDLNNARTQQDSRAYPPSTKKPRTVPALLMVKTGRRSVLRDHRALAPVEAVHQRGADGLHPGLEGNRGASEACTGPEPRSKRLGQRDAIVGRRAIFRLHEPSWRGDSEK